MSKECCPAPADATCVCYAAGQRDAMHHVRRVEERWAALRSRSEDAIAEHQALPVSAIRAVLQSVLNWMDELERDEEPAR